VPVNLERTRREIFFIFLHRPVSCCLLQYWLCESVLGLLTAFGKEALAVCLTVHLLCIVDEFLLGPRVK